MCFVKSRESITNTRSSRQALVGEMVYAQPMVYEPLLLHGAITLF